MSRTYNTSELVPAAAVVYAGLSSVVQHILFTTKYDVEGYYSVVKAASSKKDAKPDQNKEVADEINKVNTKLEWAIKSINVTLIRDWNVSTAAITLTCNLPDVNSLIPPLPDLSKIRGGNHPYLTSEDEIRIYAGYVDSPLTPITADMLDELPFDVDTELGLKHDPNKKLVPIFWGFIDKIDMVADSYRGIQCVISCRDRVRVLSDTKILSIPTLDDKNNVNIDKDGSLGYLEGRRDKILISVARAAVGDFPMAINENEVGKIGNKKCWKTVVKYPDNPDDPKEGEDALVQLYTSYENGEDRVSFLDKDVITADPARWARIAALKTLDIEARPRMHMWVQRPPMTKSGGGTSFQILNRSPLEIIQFLANTEERTTDFYASHVNGDYLFAPRVLDTSGFRDSIRSYRTYFFKSVPPGVGRPSYNQMIISMRATTSTLATFNRFFVVDSQKSGSFESTQQNIQLQIDTLPWSLDGDDRLIRPPCRTQIIYDGSLGTYGNPKGGALIVGLAASRIWSRDINGMQIKVIGDPTWYPGEAVRIYNSLLHDKGIRSEAATPESTIDKEKLLEKLNDHVVKGADPVSSVEASQMAKDIMSSISITSDKEELILPVYKARLINHTLITQGREAGFVTEIGLVTDI